GRRRNTGTAAAGTISHGRSRYPQFRLWRGRQALMSVQDEDADGQLASVADWIAGFPGSLGSLMALLQISITNSALPQIQGEIGASGTEGTWISTGYLMSEIVMIPLTAWLTRVFGLRSFL